MDWAWARNMVGTVLYFKIPEFNESDGMMRAMQCAMRTSRRLVARRTTSQNPCGDRGCGRQMAAETEPPKKVPLPAHLSVATLHKVQVFRQDGKA